MPNPSNAAASAAIQSRHRFERQQLHDAHDSQHRRLRELHHQQREREREEERGRKLVPPKRAGQHAPIRSDDEDVQDRVKAHAELDAKQRQERDAMTARHKREIDEARRQPHPSGTASPERTSGPSGPGALGAVFARLSAAQRAEYAALKQKYADQRKALDEKQGADGQRHGRYTHERTAKQMEEEREAEHRKINEAEQRAIDGLRVKFEDELRRREAERQHAETR